MKIKKIKFWWVVYFLPNMLNGYSFKEQVEFYRLAVKLEEVWR